MRRRRAISVCTGHSLRKWVKEFAADPQQAFPGHGQQKPEQAEIARLRREVTKLKAERDILKKAAAYFAKEAREVRLHREAPRHMAGGMDVRGARGLAGWLLCLADTAAQPAQPGATTSWRAKVRASFLASDRTYGARRVGMTCFRKGCPAGCIGSSD